MERFCHVMSGSWRYEDEPVKGDDVYAWIRQFKEAGFSEEAREMLLYLKREGFITRRSIIGDLKGLFDRFKKDIDSEPIVVSIQPVGKSESFLAYSLRPEIQFTDLRKALDKVSNAGSIMDLVCFDDVIISGRSMQDYLFDKKINERADSLIDAMRKGKVRLTIFVSIADIRGIAAVEGDPRGHGAVSVKAANTIDDTRRVFHTDSEVLSEKTRRTDFKGFCKKAGNNINPRNPLGWKNAQWCIATDYSVPNGTLPIIWASSSTFDWIPLFPRSRSVSTNRTKNDRRK
nr:MAG: hypothetical protein BECKUNK1418H_GA0071006_10506 [Candidatus Kentron sp. UNK]